MKKLNRFELAAVKRTAANVKTMRAKKAKLLAKIDTLNKELIQIEDSIEAWESPIRILTEGYTSEQVLSGEMEISTSLEESEAVSEEESTGIYKEPYTSSWPGTQEKDPTLDPQQY